MTNPGAEAVMIHRIENRHLRAQLFHAMEKLSAQSGVNILPRQRRKQPRRSFKKIGVGIVHTCLLLARHGMAGKKALASGFSKRLSRAFRNLRLRAAYISDECARR